MAPDAASANRAPYTWPPSSSFSTCSSMAMSLNSLDSNTSPHSRHSTNSMSSSRLTTLTRGCLQAKVLVLSGASASGEAGRNGHDGKTEEIGLIVRQPKQCVKPSAVMSLHESGSERPGSPRVRSDRPNHNPTVLIALSKPIQNTILTAPALFSTIRWQGLRVSQAGR